MTNLNSEQMLAALNWRYAVKKFDASKKVPAEAWQALEQSLVLAPSSFGLEPWKFLVVEDENLRGELRKASWGQSQVTDADKYVVFTALRTTTEDDIDALIQRTSSTRGIPAESLDGYHKVIVDFVTKGWAAKDLFAWNSRQTYLALGQFMTAAAAMGIDTCPMEGIDAAAYDELLGLKNTRYAALCACAVGYRADDDKYAAAAKVRRAADDVIERR